jgi:hypothetical protein
VYERNISSPYLELKLIYSVIQPLTQTGSAWMAKEGVQSGRLKDEARSRLRHQQIKNADRLTEAGRQQESIT